MHVIVKKSSWKHLTPTWNCVLDFICVKKYTTSRKITRLEEAQRFMIDCLLAVGTPKDYAEKVADGMIRSDYAGHYSHGMNLLHSIIRTVKTKALNPNAAPKLIMDKEDCAIVDGNNGFGTIVSRFCTDICITKAKNHGACIVLAKNSNYNRILACYTKQAIEAGLVAIVCSNTTACMSPERAKHSILGSNPISVGAPGEDEDYFLLEMATTAVSFGKIEVYRRNQLPLPMGWARDKLGRITNSPCAALEARMLLPLGGSKGFYLAVMIEILTAILSDSMTLFNEKDDTKTGLTTSHCFIMINPEYFAPNFRVRMSELMNYIRRIEPVDPRKPVMVPGDPERLHMTTVDQNEGIEYNHDQLRTCQELADALNVAPLRHMRR